MLGCVGRLGSDIAIQPGVVLAFSPWPCHRLCGSAQLRARISEDRAMPREAPPHRKRPLLRRGTTEPSNLFVSNLHNAPVCRDSSDSALFDCRKPLIGMLFGLEAHGIRRPAHPLDRRRASTGRMAEIDSVVLHRPHSLLRRADFATRSKPRLTRVRLPSPCRAAAWRCGCIDGPADNASQSWRPSHVKATSVANDSLLRHVRAVQFRALYCLRRANSEE